MCPSSSASSSAAPGLRGLAGEDGPEQHRLEQAFAVLDRDGDGSIRAGDLSVFFEKCVGQAISAEEAASMVSLADLDGDGAVDMREFLRVLAPSASSSGGSNGSSNNALRGMFDVLDADGDGLLDKHDLRSSMDAMLGHPISDEDLDIMFHHVVAPHAPSSSSSSASASASYIDFDRFSMLVSQVSAP